MSSSLYSPPRCVLLLETELGVSHMLGKCSSLSYNPGPLNYSISATASYPNQNVQDFKQNLLLAIASNATRETSSPCPWLKGLSFKGVSIPGKPSAPFIICLANSRLRSWTTAGLGPLWLSCFGEHESWVTLPSLITYS